MVCRECCNAAAGGGNWSKVSHVPSQPFSHASPQPPHPLATPPHGCSPLDCSVASNRECRNREVKKPFEMIFKLIHPIRAQFWLSSRISLKYAKYWEEKKVEKGKRYWPDQPGQALGSPPMESAQQANQAASEGQDGAVLHGNRLFHAHPQGSACQLCPGRGTAQGDQWDTPGDGWTTPRVRGLWMEQGTATEIVESTSTEATSSRDERESLLETQVGPNGPRSRYGKKKPASLCEWIPSEMTVWVPLHRIASGNQVSNMALHEAMPTSQSGANDLNPRGLHGSRSIEPAGDAGGRTLPRKRRGSDDASHHADAASCPQKDLAVRFEGPPEKRNRRRGEHE